MGILMPIRRCLLSELRLWSMWWMDYTSPLKLLIWSQGEKARRNQEHVLWWYMKVARQMIMVHAYDYIHIFKQTWLYWNMLAMMKSLRWRHILVMACPITGHTRLFVLQFVQANMKENNKAPHYWPFERASNCFPCYWPYLRRIRWRSRLK